MGIGDYVASGLGFSTTPIVRAPKRVASSGGEASNRSSNADNFEALSTYQHISPSNANSGVLSGTRFSGATNVSLTGSGQSAKTTLSTPISLYNNSANASIDINSCWTDWTDYWSQYDAATFLRWSTFTNMSLTVLTSIETSVTGTYVTSAFLTTWTATYTQTLSAHGFTDTTQRETSTGTVLWTTISLESPSTSISTYTGTEFPRAWGTLVSSSLTITTPPCTLPSDQSLLPQCQEAWSSWVDGQLAVLVTSSETCTDFTEASCLTAPKSYYSYFSLHGSVQNVPTPHCTQASVRPEQCRGLSSSYVSSWLLSKGNPTVGPFGLEGPITMTLQPNYDPMISVGYQPTTVKASDGSQLTTSYWPSTSVLAPGCSLGCGQCAITGGTVRLLYWPVASTAAQNRTMSLSDNANPHTAFAFGTSFVSPTVYVSYASIYASDSCGPIGTTHNATFIPLSDTQDLSSVWVTDPGWGASLLTYTASFNFTDLNSPVPESIYNRQPMCASWSASQYFEYWHIPQSFTNKTCPQTMPYEPFVIVPPKYLQDVDPKWAGCSIDIRDLFDPPYALHPASSAVVPTPVNDPFSTATAAPGSSVEAQPTQTKSPATPDPSLRLPNPGNDPQQHIRKQVPPDPATLLPPMIPTASADPSIGHKPSTGDPAAPDPNSAGRSASKPQSRPLKPDPRPCAGSLVSPPLESPSNGMSNGLGATIAGILGGGDPKSGTSYGTGAANSIISALGGNNAGSQESGTPHGEAAGDGADNRPVPGHSDPQNTGTSAGSSADGNTNESSESGTQDPKNADSQPDGNALEGETRAVFTVDEQSFTVNRGDPLVIGSHTIATNGPAATINGQKVSLGSDGVAIGTRSISFSTAPSAGAFVTSPGYDAISTVDGHPITASAFDGTCLRGNGEVIVSGLSFTMTLLLGGPAITDNGHIYSAAANGLLVDSSTVPFSAGIAPVTETIAAFTILGSAYTAFETLIGGQDGKTDILTPLGSTTMTLQEGQSATLGGQVISYYSDNLRIGAANEALSTIAAVQDQIIVPFSISGIAYTATEVPDPNHSGRSEVVIPEGSTTLTLSPGGSAATLGGQQISVATVG